MATAFPQDMSDWWDESTIDDYEHAGLKDVLPASCLEGWWDDLSESEQTAVLEHLALRFLKSADMATWGKEVAQVLATGETVTIKPDSILGEAGVKAFAAFKEC